MRYRWLALALFVGVLAFAAAGCGGGDDGGAEGSEDVTGSISIMAIWAGEEQESFQAVIDGFEELFFNHLGEPNRLFRVLDGTCLLIDPGSASEPDGLGTGACVADVDGDGRLELLIAHGESTIQPLSLFKAPPTGHGWLRVRPLTRFGAPARGALVKLTAGGRTQVRVIDGGSGYLCQMEPVAHFGLGDIDRVEQVQITWPDGARDVVSGPAVCSEITVAHPDG